MSKRKTERNKKIYELYKSGGYSMYVLAKRFRVTPPRILVIIRREKKNEYQLNDSSSSRKGVKNIKKLPKKEVS